MPKRALTKAKIAKVGALRAQGFTRAEIAEKLGISAGSVTNAEKQIREAKAAAAPPPPPAKPPAESNGNGQAKAAPQTLDDFRGWLGEQMVELEADVKDARAKSEHERAARAQRNLAQMVLLYGRVTKQADDSDAITVTAKDIAESAQQCREALHELVERELKRK